MYLRIKIGDSTSVQVKGKGVGFTVDVRIGKI